MSSVLPNTPSFWDFHGCNYMTPKYPRPIRSPDASDDYDCIDYSRRASHHSIFHQNTMICVKYSVNPRPAVCNHTAFTTAPLRSCQEPLPHITEITPLLSLNNRLWSNIFRKPCNRSTSDLPLQLTSFVFRKKTGTSQTLHRISWP